MNSNYPPGAENDPSAPYNERETYECPECGAPVEKEDEYCSGACFNASLL